MRKLYWFVFLSAFMLISYNLLAEEAATTGAAQAETTAVSEPAAAEPAAEPPAAPAPQTPAPTAPAEPPTPSAGTSPAAEETLNTENLEFISGEVTAMDEAAKTLTVKLYGETEDEANPKTLTVNVDETTDITDGEKDRDMKSLAAGTEVDVEYDPASNKATYIFVY